MVFHIINNIINKTFDVIESRKSNFIIKYFMRFPRKQMCAIKFIILSFKYNFNNGIIECIDNLIKYHSFYHFKVRIILISDIYKYQKV